MVTITDDYGNLVKWSGRESIWVDAHTIAERTKFNKSLGKVKYVCLVCGLESEEPKFKNRCGWKLESKYSGFHGEHLRLSE